MSRPESTLHLLKAALDQSRSTFDRTDAARRVMARMARLISEVDAEEVERQRRAILAAAERSIGVGDA